jgi:hypothetical protein
MVASRGEEQLFNILRQIFPKEEILTQFSLAEKLRLDLYLPALNVAFEYNGVQHTRRIDFFHKDKADFYLGQERDNCKQIYCSQLGINLICIDCSEDLTEELVRQKYKEIGPGTGIISNEKALPKNVLAKRRQKDLRKKNYQEYKDSDRYQQIKLQQRERQRMLYQENKKRKKNGINL